MDTYPFGKGYYMNTHLPPLGGSDSDLSGVQ